MRFWGYWLGGILVKSFYFDLMYGWFGDRNGVFECFGNVGVVDCYYLVSIIVKILFFKSFLNG